ncbi:MAG: UbiA family prenyltransferase [Calditrichia bacterium]
MVIFQYIKIALGWRNWSVFLYNAFLENFFLVLYFALVLPDFSNQFLIKVMLFYLFSVFSTSYGYLINDYADRETDALQGKKNVFSSLEKGDSILIILGVLGLSIVLGSYFVKDGPFLMIWFVWLFLATFYSLNPIRLKEKGRLGLIMVVLAQRLLPTLLVFAAFSYWSIVDIFLFCFYIFIRGFSSDLNHQLEDYHLDKRTKTNTFAVEAGYDSARKRFQIILELEKFLFAVLLLRVYWVMRNLYPGFSLVYLSFFIGYLFLYFAAWYRVRQGADRNPFLEREKNIFQFLHHPVPTIIFPLILCLHLITLNSHYIWIVIFLLINKLIVQKDLLYNNFPVLLLREKMAVWGKK